MLAVKNLVGRFCTKLRLLIYHISHLTYSHSIGRRMHRRRWFIPPHLALSLKKTLKARPEKGERGEGRKRHADSGRMRGDSPASVPAPVLSLGRRRRRRSRRKGRGGGVKNRNERKGRERKKEEAFCALSCRGFCMLFILPVEPFQRGK